MNFQEMGRYKQSLLSEFVRDENIVKCLANKEQNFLSLPIPDNPEDLIYKNIFPWRRLSEIQMTTESYITMEIKVPNINRKNDLFKDMRIYIYVFCHNDLLRTRYGVLRSDFLLHCVDKIMNENRDFGFGKTTLESMVEFEPSGNHQGYVVVYRTIEQNNDRCVKRNW